VDRTNEHVTPVPGEALGRRQFLRGIAVTGAAASAGGLLAACGGSSTPARDSASSKPKYGGNLSVGMSGGSSSDTLDPNQGLTEVDTGRAECLYEPLVKLDSDAKNEFVLAESITPHNGSLSEWVIRLRPGISWHSGKSFGAEDVIYTINRIISNDFSGTLFLGPVDVKGVKALDNLTVLVPMTTPFASFVDQLAGGWYYLYIVPSGWNGGAPDGTGPFVYQSFTAGQRSVFLRNKNYWQHGLPYLDAVTFIDFSDNAAVQDALTTGAIQAAGQLDPPQIPALANTHGVTPVTSHTGQFKPFTMRVDQAPFNNVNVRQALRLLVGRQQLIDSALDGYGVVASDVFSPYDPDFDASLHRQQDIPQAKFLLKKAGFDNDLKVTLTTSPLETGMVAMATVLAEQAAAAGVKITLQQVDPGTFFATGKYLNWTFSQDYYSYTAYLNQVAQSFLGSASPFNETHSNEEPNAHYTNLYNQANATANPSTRKQIEHEMQLLDFNQGAYIIPTFMDSLDAYSDKLRGYSTAKVGESLSNWGFRHFWFA
jgi:peptide/nickel transport system substrate-binding protein